MNSPAQMITERDFLVATRLSSKATDKFEEFGWITPRYVAWERFYSWEDAEVVCRMISLLDGNIDLKTAYEKAVQELRRKAA